jgi:hypothetical protein
MNVGIIATSLPMLRMLFANFLGYMRSCTKGVRSAGSCSSSGISGPFKSNVYFSQDDRNTNHTGSGGRAAMLCATSAQAQSRKRRTAIVKFAAGASDEIILAHEGPQALYRNLTMRVSKDYKGVG